ncbi:MAG: hypothetical protein HKN15_11390, partial [Xanthomonadales bacterium]|nr:hypothetical protein [Xanthomonadales bacterium]
MQRQLIIPGTFLLLIGLLLGTVLDSFNSPAIASDAHVAGVQHGMLMILIGLAWSYSDPGRTAALSAYSIVVG